MSATLERDVEMAALRRRVDGMEVLLYGAVRHGPDPEQVVSLFVEASRLLGVGLVPIDAAAGWGHAMSTMDEPRLLDLARRLEDPAPWRVFLRLVIQLRENGCGAEVAAGEAQLRCVIRNLLDAAGLSLVQPDDLLRTKLPLEHVLGA